MSEKTHQPTEKKLRDARRRGQIPKSRLLGSAGSIVGAVCGLAATSSWLSRELIGFATTLLATHDVTPQAALLAAVRCLAVCSLPIVGGAFVGALVTTVAMTGLQVNAELLAPKLERLDPVEGFKKIFSSKQLFEVAKSFVLAGVVGAVTVFGIRDAAPVITRSLLLSGTDAFAALMHALAPVALRSVVALFVAGVIDFAWAKYQHRKSLMMSLEEIKQEHKSAEGDPHHKSKRKSLHRQLAAQGPRRGVKSATAVVVNPTHIAIALRYDTTECEAPYIVAKGQESDAFSIRREATSLDIPIVKDIPLARSLIHYDVGEEIPEELYRAAAAVLTVALQTTERRNTNSPTPEHPV